MKTLYYRLLRRIQSAWCLFFHYPEHSQLFWREKDREFTLCAKCGMHHSHPLKNNFKIV